MYFSFHCLGALSAAFFLCMPDNKHGFLVGSNLGVAVICL